MHDNNDILAALSNNILNFTQGPRLNSLPAEQQNNLAGVLNILAEPQQPLQPQQPINPFAQHLMELKAPKPPSSFGSFLREEYLKIYPNGVGRAQ